MSVLSILPSANLLYTEEIVKEREQLLEEYDKITEKTDIRIRLAWIIRTVNLLEKQMSFENNLRIRSFARHQINKVVEKNRMLSDGR